VGAAFVRGRRVPARADHGAVLDLVDHIVLIAGICGTIAFSDGTGCWALADIAVSMAAATPASKMAFVFIEPSP
jgi:hypothetical protein